MTELLIITHLCAAGLGALVVLLFTSKPSPKETDMANKFISALDHVGTALKKFFTSPIVADVATTGIDIAEIAFPGAAPLLNGISASIAKAQSLAAAANVQGETTAQVTALAVADAQAAFQAYEQATGQTVETAQQQAIVALIVQALQNLPAAPAASTTTTAVAAPAAAAQATEAIPA